MKGTHDLRVSARTAQLLANDGDDEDGPPWRFSGVAVAAGDILHMDDGTPVLFTAEELRAAAETQTGEPLTVDHPTDDSGRPQYPPPKDETIGKVPKAGWVDDVDGVAYEATTHDEDTAKGVQAGSYEVSVHPTFELGEQDPETGAYIAENITFRDLSVVSKGDSPSNTAEWGPNQALAAYSSADISNELTADDSADDPQGLVEKLARKMGIIGNTGDRRGAVWFKDQTSDGSSVTVNEARFGDARWIPAAHLEGDEFDIGPGLSAPIGRGQAYDGGQVAMDAEIELDESLDDDTTVFVALHYAGDGGDTLEPITSADGGYFYDSAFVGVAPEGAEVTGDASAETMGAESPVDSTAANSEMDDNTRRQYVQFLTANAGFDEESVADMDDDVLEQTYELAAESAGDGDGGSNEADDPDDDPEDDDPTTIAEMTVEELGSALEDQGFVTEDNVGELADEVTAQASKSDKVDEIIANTDDYDEADREDLMASADSLVDREHERVTGAAPSQLPGTASIQAAAPTDVSSADGDEDLDEYGTGVADN